MNTTNQTMLYLQDFATALRGIKNGQIAAREGWNGKRMYIALHYPVEQEICTLPYIYMFTADKNKVPWLASQTDLLAHDWAVAPSVETLHSELYGKE